MLTRQDMIDRFGSTPMTARAGEPFYWTVHAGWGAHRYVTEDGGDTWRHVGSTSHAQQAHDDIERLEMQRIQRELK
jgi:hypothetical protein